MIEAPAPTPTAKLPLFRVGLVLAVAAIAGVVIWLVVGGNGSNPSVGGPTPKAASQSELAELATTLHHPIYWAGPKAGYTYELTKTDSGNVFVRYLPPGVKVGDSRADFVTVGTYPQTNPMRSIDSALKRNGTTRFSVHNGGVAVQDSAHPTSVYLAYPNSKLLLEIFAPNPASARSVAESGAIRPLG